MPVDYTAPLDATTLIVEVASSAYAFKCKIKASSVKVLWEKLSEFVVTTLKSQKGVLLPNLGNFMVGPVIGEVKKKVRPCFKLLERYGSVSQERGRYNIGGRAAVVQPSYGMLSTASGIHRGATQRIVAELLQRLGVHILSGRHIKCEFPGLGVLLTNRAGRLEFVFEPLVMEHFEREHYALIREMEPGDQDLAVGMQGLNLGHSSYVLSPRARTPASQAAASEGGYVVTPIHAPFTGDVLHIYRLCKQTDRIGAGTIPRAVFEGLLQREGRPLMAKLDGSTVLDLLTSYVYGKAKTLVLYQPILQAIQALIESEEPQLDEQQQQQQQQQRYQGEQGQGQQQNGEAVSEISFHGMLPGVGSPAYAGQPQGQQQQQHPFQQHQQHQAPGHQQHPAPLMMPHMPHTPSQPQDYLHYAQRQLSPRSRSEYDTFNRAHFNRLQQARGPGHKRAITPKVGEEPLNIAEYEAVRQTSPDGQVNMWRREECVSPAHFRPAGLPSQQEPAAPAGLPPSGVPGLPAPSQEPRQQPPKPAPLALPSYMGHPGSPPASYRHQSQISLILQDPYVPNHKDQLPASAPRQQVPEGASPRPRPPPVPISYHAIQKAEGAEKERLKAQLAAELQQGWQRQIQARNDFEREVHQAEREGWPYSLTNIPNDKRPASAISRPPTLSPRRGY